MARPFNPCVTSMKPSATVEMMRKVKELQRQGHAILGLSVGEPDFNTPKEICDAAYKAMLEGHTHYTDNMGMYELREAIARKLERDNHVQYAPEQIICTNGAKQAVMEAIMALCAPSDEVVIPVPAWVSYAEMATLVGATAVLVPTRYENNYLVTPSELRAALTPNSRVLVLCSPNNPTGSVYSAEQYKALAEVLKDFPDVYVISDEIYEYINYGNIAHVSFSTVPGMYDRTLLADLSAHALSLPGTAVKVNGFSKGYAMTGWRLGYVAGPLPAIQLINKVHGQTTGCCSSVSQMAGIAGLGMGDAFIKEMCEEYRKRRDYVVDALQSIPGVECFTPDGAFYVLPKVSALYGKSATIDGKTYKINTCDDLVMYLLGVHFTDAFKVAVVQGSAFGSDETIRISYATSMDVLEKSMKAIADGVSQLH